MQGHLNVLIFGQICLWFILKGHDKAAEVDIILLSLDTLIYGALFLIILNFEVIFSFILKSLSFLSWSETL